MQSDRYPMCFGCGKENPHGLRLDVQKQPDGSWQAEFTPKDYHCGWPGIVHGGILSTALDEVMSYVIFGDGRAAVTAKISVEFKKPALLGDHLMVRAAAVRETRRIVDAEGRITKADGTLVATAEGRFVVLDESQRRSLGLPQD